MTATRNLAFFAPVLIVSSSCQTRLVPSGVNETAPFVHQLNPDPLQSYPALVSEPSTNMIIEEEAPPTFDLPALSKDPLVQKWIRYFLSDGKERFQRYLNRGLPYRPAILTMFKKENLPAELFFVPLIESGFSLKARSHAGAAGPWQFMKGTGRRFGLLVNQYVDERWDLYRSTAAACIYLKRLHKVFDSWPLALAAYNAGESRVMNAILKTGTRDFWELARKKALPRETRNYVPKFLAALILSKDQNFNMTPTRVIPPLSRVAVPSMTSVTDISKALNIPYNKILTYNGYLRRGITPPGKKNYLLWIPEAHTPNSDQLAKLTTLKPTIPKSLVRHKVKNGESLYRIAKKYKTSITTIKQLNKLKNTRIHPGQSLLVPTQKQSQKSYVKYKVRRGDNLISLAKKFGMSVKKLKKLNELSRSTIYAGQVLLVHTKGSYRSI